MITQVMPLIAGHLPFFSDWGIQGFCDMDKIFVYGCFPYCSTISAENIKIAQEVPLIAGHLPSFRPDLFIYARL